MKIRFRAHVSEDCPTRKFNNYGFFFTQGQTTDLPKLAEDQRRWLDEHEYIELEEVEELVTESDKSGKVIDLSIIPVFSTISLRRELKARGVEDTKDRTDDDKMRAELEAIMRVELGLSADGFDELGYNDLRVKAKELGVNTKGSKKTLLARIREHVAEDEPVDSEEEDVSEEEDETEESEPVPPVSDTGGAIESGDSEAEDEPEGNEPATPGSDVNEEE